jgi:hypothetical protein
MAKPSLGESPARVVSLAAIAYALLRLARQFEWLTDADISGGPFGVVERYAEHMGQKVDSLCASFDGISGSLQGIGEIISDAVETINAKEN